MYLFVVSKNSAIFKHIQGRHLNVPNKYPNRAIQSSGGADRMYVNHNELITCLGKTYPIVMETPSIDRKEEKDVFENVVRVDIAKCAEIAIETQDQNTNSWRIYRSKRITASSAYKLYTYLSNKSPDWDKKISQYWDAKTLKVAATKYGKEAEPFAFNCYRKLNPNIKKCGLVIHPTECWIAGSPDGLDPTSDIVLEIKCPMNKDASMDDIMNSNAVKVYIKKCPTSDVLSLNNRHAYYCQVQINMFILNCKRCDFVLYSMKDDNFVLIDVPFDEQFVTTVVNALKKLYFERMLRRLVV